MYLKVVDDIWRKKKANKMIEAICEEEFSLFLFSSLVVVVVFFFCWLDDVEYNVCDLIPG